PGAELPKRPALRFDAPPAGGPEREHAVAPALLRRAAKEPVEDAGREGGAERADHQGGPQDLKHEHADSALPSGRSRGPARPGTPFTPDSRGPPRPAGSASASLARARKSGVSAPRPRIPSAGYATGSRR